MGKRVRERKQRKELERTAVLQAATQRKRLRRAPRWRMFWGALSVLVMVSIVLVAGFAIKNHFAKTLPNRITIPPSNDALTASITTNRGVITFKLYGKDAPKAVENFVTLSQRGYYNGLKFHRVEPGFVIQGGDPKGDGTGGDSAWGGAFNDELDPNTASYKEGYVEGVVAMANSGPNTNKSQFFITLADQPNLPHSYTIFGKVTAGLDVVHKIQVGDVMESFKIEGLK